MSGFECSICWEFCSDITDDHFVRTKCGHVYHNSCIEKSIHVNGKSCPQCRTVLNTKNLPLHGIYPSNREKKFKIALLGDSGVGKSCLIHQYTDRVFIDNQTATIGLDLKTKTLTLNEEEITLQIYDTSGQERYQSVTPQYVRNCQGVIIVFATNDYTTLQNVGMWCDFVNDYAPNAVKILVGAKSDIAEGTEGRSRPTETQKQDVADKLKMCRFETSAKTDTNIDVAFKALVGEILQNKLLLRQARMQNEPNLGARVNLTTSDVIQEEEEPSCWC